MGNELAAVTKETEVAPIKGGDDDDVIQVDTDEKRTPQQRAADLLARLTAADARIAQAEARRPRFRPRLEREYKQFCLAYGYADTPNARLLFAQYLQNAGLGTRRTAPTQAQQAATAMQVLFADIKPGERVPVTAIGVREALDPRTPLTDDQRAKLAEIVLDDGRTALAARTAAEQLWAKHQINLVIDVGDAYASKNPHLAAFTSAARDAGYTQQEIDMATAGATAAQLWRPLGGTDAMPGTLAEFQQQYGGERQRQFLLDVTVLEDARAAIAQGLTLDQLYAARKQAGYDPSFRSKMTDESVSTVVNTFVPPELVPVVGPLLTQLVAGVPARRAEASRQLQALIYDGKRIGPARAKALRDAVDGLMVQFGKGDDPMLKLLRVQLDLEANPPDVDLMKLLDQDRKTTDQVAKATRQIEALRETLRERQAAGNLPRDEAARLYEMMSFLYRGYVGNVEQAEWCRTMARMYRSNQEEREDAQQRMQNPLGGEVLVPRRSPDEPTSIRGETKDEKELRLLEEEDEAMVAEVESELGQNEKEFPKRPRDVPQPLDTERGNENHERVEATAGFVVLIRQALEWYIAGRRMNELADRRERERELRERIKRERTVRVPPPPAKLREVIAWLQAHGHEQLAVKLREVLDAALAFYDTR